MSIVMAIKGSDRIYLAADSQATCNRLTYTCPDSIQKAWKCNGEDVAVGGVGSLRDLNIISTRDQKWVDRASEIDGVIDIKYVIRNVVPALIKELETNGRVRIRDSMKSFDSEYIFAYKDKFFMIDDAGGVLEGTDALFIGAGLRLSIGAWEAIKDNELSIQEKIIKCIKAAELDVSISGPIKVVNTLNNDVMTIDI